MQYDDVIYLLLLIFSIGFGYFYRNFKKDEKLKYGTYAGLFIVLVVSKLHIIHPLLIYLVNVLIINFVNKRFCHVASFIFSFSYLIFFRTTEYFGIPYPPAHTNLIQMMLTLKIVGLAFDINSSYTSDIKTETTKSTEQMLEEQHYKIEPSSLDVFHFCFNYIGILTGPIYRYKTFQDMIEKPYANYIDTWKSTLDKLKLVPIFALLFLWGTYNWPISYALSDEFYTERSFLYRYFYIWPNFFIFRMRMYIGLTLGECVCTMAGLGAYPTFTNPKAGKGPSEHFAKLKVLENHREEFQTLTYNFETIHNINVYGAEFCTTYREAIKHWNICIQYWMAVNIYKRFPYKHLRTVVTMMVSAFWHGVYLGYYVCIGTVPFVLALEDVWYKLLLKDNDGKNLIIYEWIVWFFRMHFFGYQAIAFHLLTVNAIIHYYNSIYHFGLLLGIVLYLTGLVLLKSKKKKKELSD